MTEEFLLIEILPVQSVLNGSAVTTVRLDQLYKEHRRHKREITKKKKTLSRSYERESRLSVSQISKA